MKKPCAWRKYYYQNIAPPPQIVENGHWTYLKERVGSSHIKFSLLFFSYICFCLLLFSCYVLVQLFATSWSAACQSSLSITGSEFAQTHVHWVSDAIQLSHPLLPPFPLAFNFSQFMDLFPLSQLFASSGQSIGASASASVLPMNIQDWFPLGWTGLISLLSKGLSRVSSTVVQKCQFFQAQPSLWSNSHIHAWLLENHSFVYRNLCCIFVFISY